MIPFYRPYYDRSELMAALRPGVGRSDFESALASRVGARYGVAFAYGRSGVVASLRALELHDAEVILPAYTCETMSKSVVASGNRPAFVDIKLDDYTMDINALKRSLTSQTRVVVATHLFGYPCDVNSIRTAVAHDQVIIFEDCAQGFPGSSPEGGRLRGDLGLLSFGPGKPFCTAKGGMIVTNSIDLYERIKSYRDREMNQPSVLVWAKRWAWFLASYLVFRQPLYTLQHHYRRRIRSISKASLKHDPSPEAMPGDMTAKYTDFQARIGLIQLDKLDEMRSKRRALVELYNEELDGIVGINPPPLKEGSVYSFCSLRVPRRDKSGFVQGMINRGVAVDQSYDYVLPDLKPYRAFASGEYPSAVQAAGEVVNLPCYPHLKESQIRHIASCVRECAHEIYIKRKNPYKSGNK